MEAKNKSIIHRNDEQTALAVAILLFCLVAISLGMFVYAVIRPCDTDFHPCAVCMKKYGMLCSNPFGSVQLPDGFGNEGAEMQEEFSPLEQKVNLYHARLRQFYKYNYSNRGKELTPEQLIRQGGVCSHYADYYVGQAQLDGLAAKKVKIYFNESQDHAVAIISDSSGYCVADQLDYWCKRLAR